MSREESRSMPPGWLRLSLWDSGASTGHAPASDGGASWTTVSGDPHEQGLHHGRAAAARIAENLRMARRLVDEQMLTVGQDAWREAFSVCRAFAERADPTLADEVTGIAEGSRTEAEDIWLLNVPLFLVLRFRGVGSPQQECTHVVVDGRRTATRGALLGKTRDFTSLPLRPLALVRSYHDGVRLIEVTVAGSVTWPGSGLSSTGVALGTSGVWKRSHDASVSVGSDMLREGWVLLNTHLLLRRSTSLEDLVALTEQQPRLTGLNVTAADATGAATLEVTPSTVVVSPAREGWACLTNHYVSTSLYDCTPTPEQYPSSYHRYEVAERAVAGASKWTAANVAELLSSHDGYPQSSICRHPGAKGAAETTYGSVIDVAGGCAYVAMGNPCTAGILCEEGTRAL